MFAESDPSIRTGYKQVFQSPVILDLINKMPLFGKASKSPVELVRVLKESLLLLEKGADGKKQVSFSILIILSYTETIVIVPKI